MSPPAIPYVATVTASAEESTAPAWGAIVRDDKRRWCVKDGVGATLTVTFDRPVMIADVTLRTDDNVPGFTIPTQIEIDTGTKTVAATNGDIGWLRVPLGGAPTTRLTLKAKSLRDATVRRMCVDELVMTTEGNSIVPFVVGAPPEAAAALPAFVRGLDAALAACDVKGIADAVAFPLAVTMHFDSRPADPASKKPVVMRYGSARELASACANDGRMIMLGSAAGFYGDLSTLTPSAPGLVHLGDPEVGWRLAWKGGWRVTGADLHDPTFRSDGWGDAPGPVALWLAKLGGADVPSRQAQETAADALFVALDSKSAIVSRDQFLAAVGPFQDGSIERVTGARTGTGGWMVFVSSGGDEETRVSALIETVDETSQVIAAFASSSHGGKATAIAPLPPLTRDTTLTAHPDVLAAVTKLVSGPIDTVAASRPDLVAIGAGAGETTVGGTKLAPIWKSRWANQLRVTGVVGRVATSGRTVFVVIDATKARTAYRIAMVLDETASGAWSLGHLHIAQP